VGTAEYVGPGTGLPQFVPGGPTNAWPGPGTQMLDPTAGSHDQLSATFNEVMTSIDREAYSGDEKDLFSWPTESGPGLGQPSPPQSTDRSLTSRPKKASPRNNSNSKGTATVAASLISTNCFAKVELYSNSRLPMDLPPLKL
jgi:hypothetical protein